MCKLHWDGRIEICLSNQSLRSSARGTAGRQDGLSCMHYIHLYYYKHLLRLHCSRRCFRHNMSVSNVRALQG